MPRAISLEHALRSAARHRHSARAFRDAPVSAADLRAVLEAARWAPSSYNEQPWRFLVGRREEAEAFRTLLRCLSDGNRRWAAAAPVLVIACTRRTFSHDERDNPHARHDLGLALGQLSLEAAARGLQVHPMGGFDAARARELCAIPEPFEPVTALALGHPGAPDLLPDDLRAKETAPRARRAQRETVFGATFGEPLATEADATPERVLTFWLGELDAHGLAAPEQRALWFRKDAGFDAMIRACFRADHAAIVAGRREGWLGTPRGRLAYVVVLDQFARNMFRGTPEMFSADERAVHAALEGVGLGHHLTLAVDERIFLLMPLMHAEDLALQERLIALLGELQEGLAPPARERVAQTLHYARLHRDIVARFGRFPHRNAILGRDTTPEEAAFLAQPGSSF